MHQLQDILPDDFTCVIVPIGTNAPLIRFRGYYGKERGTKFWKMLEEDVFVLMYLNIDADDHTVVNLLDSILGFKVDHAWMIDKIIEMMGSAREDIANGRMPKYYKQRKWITKTGTSLMKNISQDNKVLIAGAITDWSFKLHKKITQKAIAEVTNLSVMTVRRSWDEFKGFAKYTQEQHRILVLEAVGEIPGVLDRLDKIEEKLKGK